MQQRSGGLDATTRVRRWLSAGEVNMAKEIIKLRLKERQER